MKLHQDPEFPFSRFQAPRKASKVVPIIALVFVVTVVPLYFPSAHEKLFLGFYIIGFYNAEKTWVPSSDPPPKPWRADGEAAVRDSLTRAQLSKKSLPNSGDRTDAAVSNSSNSEGISTDGRDRGTSPDGEECDLFTGEWVPNPDGPYYTNMSCDVIQEQQNCMKYGRPDREFLKWRWKPDGCELPILDPDRFLEMLRGKSLAFVGDSVARNQMQSLICLLTRVAYPVNLTGPTDQNNRLYAYPGYNFNISFFSSQYLVRTERANNSNFTSPYNLFLDEFDENWTAKVEGFDYIIISGGPWFFRPTYFYLNRTLVGCLHCTEPNVTHRTLFFSYRWAFRTALRAITGAGGFRGAAFLRTFSPSHFEGGAWDGGGDCVRTRPWRRNETALEYYIKEMLEIQVEEVRITKRATGGRVRLFDATRPMLLRPDGHPGKYGRWVVTNQTFSNDCVHWCLPGPIDAWNDMLQELVKRETVKL